MALDPITIIMFALIAVLIFFMFRNGRKRQAAQQEMQNGLRPGAEVMLQSGIYGTIDSVDAEDNRVTLRSGSSTLVVHRNAISQIVTPVDAPAAEAEGVQIAPDDDPEFGERIAQDQASEQAGTVPGEAVGASDDAEAAGEEQPGDEDRPGDDKKPEA